MVPDAIALSFVWGQRSDDKRNERESKKQTKGLEAQLRCLEITKMHVKATQDNIRGVN